MASIVYPLAGKIEEALAPLLPAAIARQIADLDAFLLGSYGVQHGTVLVVLVLLALALPLLLAPVFSSGALCFFSVFALWRCGFSQCCDALQRTAKRSPRKDETLC